MTVSVMPTQQMWNTGQSQHEKYAANTFRLLKNVS